MLTLFLVFIITKGALTLYEGNTIGSGAVRGGDTAQYVVYISVLLPSWLGQPASCLYGVCGGVLLLPIPALLLFLVKIKKVLLKYSVRRTNM